MNWLIYHINHIDFSAQSLKMSIGFQLLKKTPFLAEVLQVSKKIRTIHIVFFFNQQKHFSTIIAFNSLNKPKKALPQKN